MPGGEEYQPQVPSELLWFILLQKELDQKLNQKKARELDPEELFISLKISTALDRLIERYDIPQYWFEEVISNSSGKKYNNKDFVNFVPSDKKRPLRRRKTWTNMERDLLIYIYHLQGKTVAQIAAIFWDQNKRPPRNIKSIIYNVHYRKLGFEPGQQ